MAVDALGKGHGLPRGLAGAPLPNLSHRVSRLQEASNGFTRHHRQGVPSGQRPGHLPGGTTVSPTRREPGCCAITPRNKTSTNSFVWAPSPGWRPPRRNPSPISATAANRGGIANLTRSGAAPSGSSPTTGVPRPSGCTSGRPTAGWPARPCRARRPKLLRRLACPAPRRPPMAGVATPHPRVPAAPIAPLSDCHASGSTGRFRSGRSTVASEWRRCQSYEIDRHYHVSGAGRSGDNCLNRPEMVKSRPPRWSMAAGVAVGRRHLHYASGRRSPATCGCHQLAARLSRKARRGRALAP